MFDKNSSRSRNGHISSNGFDTMVPSANLIDWTLGDRGSSGITITSHTTGSSRARTSNICFLKFFDPEIRKALMPYASVTFTISGSVKPLLESAPVSLLKYVLWEALIEPYWFFVKVSG